MSTKPITSGYYGKVSTHGDFVSRGLPVSFTDPWDAWLQEAIFSSQQKLGDNWLDCYLTGPIYRFVLSPGICGENSWLGIMMPSVDRIGRYYPMTITTMNRLNINPFIALEKELSWFSQVETLALSSLADDFSLEQFNLEINELKPDIFYNNCEPSLHSEQINKQPSHHAWQQSMEASQQISDMLPCFLDNLLKEQCFAYSLWWTQGSEQVSPSLLVCEGLPPFDGVAAMFDGNWQKWGWEGNRYPVFPFGKQPNDETNT
jgi:type VI secretion system protein ImpM